MNPFRNLFNNQSPGVRTTTIDPATGAARVVYVPDAAAAIAREGRTDDELNYGTPFFIPGIQWRRGRAAFHYRPVITAELLRAVVKEAGELWSGEDEEKVAVIAAQLKRANDQLNENAYANVSLALPAFFSAQIDAAIMKGEQPPSAPSFNERQAQTQHVRQAIHRRKNQLYAEAFAILKPGLLRFAKAAWSLAKDQERAERGGPLRRWRMEFVPSDPLRSCVYLALRAGEPILDFEDRRTIEVSTDPLRQWGYLLEAQPAPPPLPWKEFQEQTVNVEARQRQRELDKKESDKASAEHDAKVAEVSRLNDAIRLQGPGAPPPMAGYSAGTVPAPETEAPKEP